MEVKEIVRAGVLVAGLTAGVAVTQNQVQISRSGRTDLPQVLQGTVSDATGGVNDVRLSAAGGRAGFAETGPLNLDRLVDGAYVSGVLLYNPNCTAETVKLTPQLLDRNAEPLDVALETGRSPAAGQNQKWTIQPGAYERVLFRIKQAPKSGKAAGSESVFDAVRAALLSSPMHYGDWTGRLPARGVLVLTRHTEAGKTHVGKTEAGKTAECTTSGAVPSSTSRELVLQPPLPSAVDTGVLLVSLFLSMTVTLIASIIIFGSSNLFLRARMGDVTFDFKNSWGANVAVGAGILTALTSAAVLSQDKYSSNSITYLVLATLFAAFVLLGAALYGLIRPTVALPAAGTQPQGYVSVYLLSSAVVLWGAFGQLLLLGMFLRELTLARVIATEPAYILILMTKGLIVLLVVYAVITAYATVKESSQKTSTAAPATERPRASMI